MKPPSIFKYFLSWNPKDVQWLKRLRDIQLITEIQIQYVVQKHDGGNGLFNDNAI